MFGNMARPKGLRMNRKAFDLALRASVMSKSEVAQASKKNLSFISDLYAGRYRASPATITAIANALHTDAGALFPDLEGWSDNFAEVA